VWRKNNNARLRRCERPVIWTYERYFRYTPDADDVGAGISALRVTDDLCDTNENAYDQETFRGHIGPLCHVQMARLYHRLFGGAGGIQRRVECESSVHRMSVDRPTIDFRAHLRALYRQIRQPITRDEWLGPYRKCRGVYRSDLNTR
jgi:hypothetical protein